MPSVSGLVVRMPTWIERRSRPAPRPRRGRTWCRGRCGGPAVGPGVGVGVELDERQGAVDGGVRPEERQAHEVVAAEREARGPRGEDGRAVRLEPGGEGRHVGVVERHVAVIDHAQRRHRVHRPAIGRLEGLERAGFADGAGAEARAGAVGGGHVEGHAGDGHVGAREILGVGPAQEARDAAEGVLEGVAPARPGDGEVHVARGLVESHGRAPRRGGPGEARGRRLGNRRRAPPGGNQAPRGTSGTTLPHRGREPRGMPMGRRGAAGAALAASAGPAAPRTSAAPRERGGVDPPARCKTLRPAPRGRAPKLGQDVPAGSPARARAGRRPEGPYASARASARDLPAASCASVAAMKRSRSPSSTPWVSEVSSPVLRSFTI